MLRVAMCVVFGFTSGVALYRASARSSTVRGQLIVSAVANSAIFAGQVTLFGTPFTIRTAFAGAVAVADVVWLALLFRHGPPDTSDL